MWRVGTVTHLWDGFVVSLSGRGRRCLRRPRQSHFPGGLPSVTRSPQGLLRLSSPWLLEEVETEGGHGHGRGRVVQVGLSRRLATVSSGGFTVARVMRRPLRSEPRETPAAWPGLPPSRPTPLSPSRQTLSHQGTQPCPQMSSPCWEPMGLPGQRGSPLRAWLTQRGLHK